MHHGEQAMPEDVRKQMFSSVLEKFGATGNFPEGKLVENDQGEIQFGITHHAGKVIIDFGKPVAWVGMSAGQARDLGRALFYHSHRCDDKKPPAEVSPCKAEEVKP